MKDVLEYASYRQYIADYYASTSRTITPTERPSPHLLGRSSHRQQAFLRQSTLNT